MVQRRFLGIEEPADAAEMLILLPAHDAAMCGILAEELRFGLGQRNVKMLGDALGIAILHFDDGVGAAITRAFQAIIFLARHRLFLLTLGFMELNLRCVSANSDISHSRNDRAGADSFDPLARTKK